MTKKPYQRKESTPMNEIKRMIQRNNAAKVQS